MFFVPYFVKHFVTCSLNRRFKSFTLDLLAYAEVAPDCERLGPLLDLGLLLDTGLLLDLLLLHDLGRTLRLALDPLRTRRVGARRFALRAPVFTLAKGAAGARQAAVFPLAVGSPCSPRSCLSHCREGRACTLHSSSSARREGKVCTPCRRFPPFRGDLDCTRCSRVSPSCASTASLA